MYCTTCLVTKRYYIGVHKTAVPDDMYLGSGKWLRNAVKKYGEGNFCKDVLFTYSTPEEAFAKEEILVRCHRRNTLCMNIRKGGAGGWDYVNVSGIAQRTKHLTGMLLQQKFATDPVYRARMQAAWREHISAVRPLAIAGSIKAGNHVKATRAWTGCHHSDSAKAAISAGHKGELNSQFGTCWITDGSRNRKIVRVAVVPDGWHIGRTQKILPRISWKYRGVA